MKGDLIQVKDPFCKRSKRAISENNYQYGSEEINRLLIDKKTLPEVLSEMNLLGYQIPKTRKERNKIIANLKNPPFKPKKKTNQSTDTFCKYEQEI